MRNNPFVLPFTIGLMIMMTVLAYRFISWITKLSREQRNTIIRNLISFKSIRGIIEVFSESLLHRRIFRKNRLLGYMHMSLAFGWFLLIVVGHFESSAYFGTALEPPYVPIFLRYFQIDATHSTAQKGYWFIMDLILLFVLSGVMLAWFKRIRSRKFGIKRVTNHLIGDRVALTVLWFIFPLRLIAESITSILYGGGSFLTYGLGTLLENNIASTSTFYISWWAYSMSLGIFFVALPFSRYMHIPSEIVLIMMRNWGVKSQKNALCGFKMFDLHSCSSCGICLDSCQLNFDAEICNVQSPYIFRALRGHIIKDNNLHNCLMCGRCETSCVVGINTNDIRQAARNKYSNYIETDFEYVKPVKYTYKSHPDVLYFAGCMSHLTPGIKKSMTQIFKIAGINYESMDENESICCGRPMMLAGLTEQAQALIDKNKEIIHDSKAKILVTSCPICYKVFKNDYNLSISVMHHTQYLEQLIKSGKIKPDYTGEQVVYHDPCELGRGSGIYEEPRWVLEKIAVLKSGTEQKDQSLCCGGSIANSAISSYDRIKIASETLSVLTGVEKTKLITACPLCKRTFTAVAQKHSILDISEYVYQNLIQNSKNIKQKTISHKQTAKLILN